MRVLDPDVPEWVKVAIERDEAIEDAEREE